MTDANDLLKQLQAQMEAFAASMKQAEADLAPIKDELVQLNAAENLLRTEYQARLTEMREKRAKIDEARFEKEKAVNAAKQAMNAAQLEVQKLNQELEAKKAEEAAKKAEAEQYLALTERFDAASAGAKWREWAKDHQIKAGHKIAMDRYVLLADPMGLGKTLSSIVTADIVQSVTKACNPDFPFLGEEKDVFMPERVVWTAEGVEAAKNHQWPFEPDSQWAAYLSNDADGNLMFRNRPLAEGEYIAGYIAYDLKNRLADRGVATIVPAGYEKKIVNSIERPVGRKILYICPAPLLRNVLEEWRKWAPHRNVTYIGGMSKAERNFVLDLTLPHLQEYVIIVNYEAWRRDKELLVKLASCKFDTVIFDEAHMVKDMKSQAFKGVKQLVTELDPEYIIPMTGTPILNKPQELFSILNIMLPTQFHTERDFLWSYCEEYENNDGQMKWRFKPGGLDLLSKKLSRNFLRRTKKEAGIQLPEKSIIYHELPLDVNSYPAQSRAREHMKKYATLVIDEKKGKALQATVMIALITRLRQIETWPAGIVVKDKESGNVIFELGEKFAESQKIDYIIRKDSDGEWEGLIPDTVEDERIVVFSQFKAPLAELKTRIEASGHTAVILDGSTPPKLRDEIRHDFDRSITPDRTNSKWDVLLANYKAAGVGLNLTNATQLITLDEEWNPGKREQAWDRIHRIGQTENVTINVVRTQGTIDTWLASIIEDKQNIVEGFESAMNLSLDDLKDYLEGGGLA